MSFVKATLEGTTVNDTELDALLAPPELAEPADRDGDLAALAVAARGRATRARRTPRIVAAGAALTLLLGGATAAAAASGIIEWDPWAEQAVNRTFTLPSGAECEFRMGNVMIGDPKAAAAAQDIIDHTDFVAELDVEAVMADYAQAGSTATGDDAYRQAIATGSVVLVLEKLRDQGFDVDAPYFGSISGEGHCVEAAE